MHAKYALTRNGLFIAVSDTHVYLQKIIDSFYGSLDEFAILTFPTNYLPPFIPLGNYIPLPTPI